MECGFFLFEKKFHSKITKILDLCMHCILLIFEIFYFLKPSRTDSTPTNSSTPEEECSVIIDMNKFEEFSKRAWTDVFLQIYKVTLLFVKKKSLKIFYLKE